MVTCYSNNKKLIHLPNVCSSWEVSNEDVKSYLVLPHLSIYSLACQPLSQRPALGDAWEKNWAQSPN